MSEVGTLHCQVSFEWEFIINGTVSPQLHFEWETAVVHYTSPLAITLYIYMYTISC